MKAHHNKNKNEKKVFRKKNFHCPSVSEQISVWKYSTQISTIFLKLIIFKVLLLPSRLCNQTTFTNSVLVKWLILEISYTCFWVVFCNKKCAIKKYKTRVTIVEQFWSKKKCNKKLIITINPVITLIVGIKRKKKLFQKGEIWKKSFYLEKRSQFSFIFARET